MSKSKVFESLGRAYENAKFSCKKHSPEIFIGIGIISGIGGAIFACKATIKAVDIVNNGKKMMKSVKECEEKTYYVDEDGKTKEYTNDDSKRDRALICVQTGTKLLKEYAPAIGLGIVSIGCILTSHRILRKRNLALAAAYTAVDKGFKEYRKRVAKRFGEEVEKDIFHNVRTEEIEVKEKDENGKEKTVKKEIKVVDPGQASPFSRFFDETSSCWTKNWDANMTFLTGQQAHANNLLYARGYLLLNEVYEMLGFEPTQAGYTVGWIFDKTGKMGTDNFVDFGITNIYRDNVPSATNHGLRNFQNGYEYSVLLDFNVDGTIIDKTPLRKV